MTTVRDASFDILRRLDMTTIFSNPGSTEVSLLTDLPNDLEFVLALHEASVVGIATGHALASNAPALVILHTTAGLGNAVGALATARVNRAPLVVIVGQQDRRHLALEPFLAGRLDTLAGDYPVWVNSPVLPQDVPGALARAYFEASHGKGPALVIVPMDDWTAEASTISEDAAPRRVLRSPSVSGNDIADIASSIDESTHLALVVGAGLDSPEGWSAAVALAERLGCDVFQEAFGARAGFPQDHVQFRGHLPAGREALRTVLDSYDLVLCIGAPVFRQYPFEDGRLVPPSTRVLLVTDDPAEAHRSPAETVLLADPATTAGRLAGVVGVKHRAADPAPAEQTASPAATRPAADGPLRPVDLFSELAARLPEDTIIVEETPSSRPDLHRLIPARAPLGFVSAAMGGLGFAMPAAIGLKMAAPDRPVVAIVGDGSSLYSIQSLWSAMKYEVGVVFVVLANGRYAIMDRLAAHEQTGPAPWPSFEQVSVSTLAEGLGCPTIAVTRHSELTGLLDNLIPEIAARTSPLLVEVAVGV